MQKGVAGYFNDMFFLKQHELAAVRRLQHSLGERHAADLSNQLFVVQHRRVPLQLQEVKQFLHFLLGVKDEVLVADG